VCTMADVHSSRKIPCWLFGLEEVAGSINDRTDELRASRKNTRACMTGGTIFHDSRDGSCRVHDKRGKNLCTNIGWWVDEGISDGCTCWEHEVPYTSGIEMPTGRVHRLDDGNLGWLEKGR
jgi:hypothetical protein